jgi:DNA-binding beta-propeller fold protein YncE
MKLSFKLLLLLFASMLFFSSCIEDETNPFPSELVKGAYIVNYGNYGAGGASIAKFDYEKGEIVNNYYKTQNDGLELLSNIQFAYEYSDSIYLLGNESDQLIVVNPFFIQTRNGITDDIAKPRFCVAHGDYLYISCWGEEPDWTEMPDTYIAKFNIKTSKVDAKIAVPGGPEGLAIANNKLFAALNYVNKIAVIDLTSNSISYIETPAVSSYFIKDKNENLYATLISTWSNFSSETGLGYINTKTNVLEQVYNTDGVSTEYGSILVANSEFSKIYLLKTQYDENWELSGAVAEYNVSSGSFSTLIEGISGPKGISYSNDDKKLYVFTGESVVSGGSLKVYAEDGQLEKTHETGISPFMAIYLD